MKLRPPIAGHSSIELLRTGTCADSLWRLLTEQGVRFPPNPCAPLRRFTWHPRWPYVPLSRVSKSKVLTIAFAAPASSSDSAFNRANQCQGFVGTFWGTRKERLGDGLAAVN